MDPSIMKLLEEDEDESMHSGADVDAFQAALNRDLGGGGGNDGVDLSQLQSSDSSFDLLSQGGCSSSTQSFQQWQASSKEGKPEAQSQGDIKTGQQGEHNSSQMQSKQHLTGMQTQQNPFPVPEPERAQNPDSESQYIKLQRMSNQQATMTEQVNSGITKNKQVPFALLLPGIMPHLDKDRAMQVQTLFSKLKKNEIPKDGFVRNMRTIVGDEMLRLAVMKLQPQQIGSGNSLPPTQQQHARISTAIANTAQSNNSQSFAQLQKSNSLPASSSHLASSTLQVQSSLTHPKVTGGMERQSESNGIPFGYNSYSGPNVNPSSSTLKLQSHESQMRPTSLHHGVRSPQLGGTTRAMNAMNVSVYEKPSSMSDSKRMHGGPQAHFSNNSTLQQNAIEQSGPLSSVNSVKHETVNQSNENQNRFHLPVPRGLPTFSSAHEEKLNRKPSNTGFPAPSILPSNSVSSPLTSRVDANAQLGSRKLTAAVPDGINARAMPNKPAVGQKKPLEVPGSSLPPSGKKQKVSGAFLDQGIDQLNDVAAVSGVDLREEEEQLFSRSKEDNRASEATRRFVQDEEKNLILQKIPLLKKLAEIMAKFGLKNMSNDVERCLSLSVEERLRGLLCNAIRVSKQRVDDEKPRHRTIITSDVRRQIMSINKKAREEWEKKQAENDPESNNEIGGEKEKDELRVKSNKAKEEDEKMRATAANVAARAAAGGDDMLSKWQLMAEQNRQKREGEVDAASGSHRRNTSSSKIISGNQEAKKRGHAASFTASGATRKFGRSQIVRSQPQVARTISVKDVIPVLEREPQMSKSTLLYRLFSRIPSYAVE